MIGDWLQMTQKIRNSMHKQEKKLKMIRKANNIARKNKCKKDQKLICSDLKY